jgi:hypothetical protein
MKKLSTFLMVIAMGATLVGCAMQSKDIRTESTNKTVVTFSEVKNESSIPQGFSDLLIKASIKTHEEGYYWLEPSDTMHGKPTYPFEINIDGQSIIWQADGKKENTPAYDERGNKNSEGGTGVKYLLEKKIRLTSGSHLISLTIPAENKFKKVQITLREGELQVLEFKPVYKQPKLGRRYDKPFLYEIENYNVLLNGKSIDS